VARLIDRSGVERFGGTILDGGIQLGYDVADTVNLFAGGVTLNTITLPLPGPVLVLWTARIRSPAPNNFPHDLHFGGNLGSAVDVTIQPGVDETISGLWLVAGGASFAVGGVDDQAGTDATAVYAVKTFAAVVA
jgi:hypothetical protein